MSPAVALLEELAARGVTAEARDGALVLRPAAEVGPELRERLRDAKPELLALLEAMALAGRDAGGATATRTRARASGGPPGGPAACAPAGALLGAPGEPGGGAGFDPGEPAAGGQTGQPRAHAHAREAERATLPPGADPDRPPAGWIYCREGTLRGLWIGPSGEVETMPAGPGWRP